MRADAVAKRKSVVEAAWRLFSDEGAVEVPMRAIATEAGVGVGTLYRHFPSREDLVLGIAEAVRDRVVTIARRAEDGWEAEPGAAWVRFVRELGSLRLGSLGPRLAAMRAEGEVPSGADGYRDDSIAAVTRVLERAAGEGFVPEDITPFRFNVGLAALTRPLPEFVLEMVPGQHDWMVEVYLRGLRAMAREG